MGPYHQHIVAVSAASQSTRLTLLLAHGAGGERRVYARAFGDAAHQASGSPDGVDLASLPGSEDVNQARSPGHPTGDRSGAEKSHHVRIDEAEILHDCRARHAREETSEIGIDLKASDDVAVAVKRACEVGDRREPGGKTDVLGEAVFSRRVGPDRLDIRCGRQLDTGGARRAHVCTASEEHAR
jgi:hypothetical protein